MKAPVFTPETLNGRLLLHVPGAGGSSVEVVSVCVGPDDTGVVMVKTTDRRGTLLRWYFKDVERASLTDAMLAWLGSGASLHRERDPSRYLDPSKFDTIQAPALPAASEDAR